MAEQAEAQLYACSELRAAIERERRLADAHNMSLDKWLATRWQVLRDEQTSTRPNSTEPEITDADARRWISLRFALFVDQFIHEPR